jgi:hypothetical protein
MQSDSDDSKELTNVTLRIEPEVAEAFLRYCEESNHLKYHVLAEAVENFAMLLENPHLLDPRHRDFLFLRRPKTRGRKDVIGTTLSATTKATLDRIKGKHSTARVVNEALRIYCQQHEREHAAAYNPIKLSRFCGPLHIDLDDVDTSHLYPMLPNNLSLARDQMLVPGRLQKATVLVDSSYLLGTMIGASRTMIASSEGYARDGTLLKPLFNGELVLSTTTAQLAEFSELAAGIFSLRTKDDFPGFVQARQAPMMTSAMGTKLRERLQDLQSCGIAVIPVEPIDYVRGCEIARNAWPVSMAKLVGLAALTRVTGTSRISVLSLYRTKTISPLQVWEHFCDGFCGEISSSDARYPSYRTSESMGKDDVVGTAVSPRTLPHTPRLHPVFQR